MEPSPRPQPCVQRAGSGSQAQDQSQRNDWCHSPQPAQPQTRGCPLGRGAEKEKGMGRETPGGEAPAPRRSCHRTTRPCRRRLHHLPHAPRPGLPLLGTCWAVPKTPHSHQGEGQRQAVDPHHHHQHHHHHQQRWRRWQGQPGGLSAVQGSRGNAHPVGVPATGARETPPPPVCCPPEWWHPG